MTVDTQTSITDITLVNDHGVPDDNLTNSTRPQFEITVPADVNSVQLSIDGGANWVSAAQGIEGVWGYTANGYGRWKTHPYRHGHRQSGQYGDANA